MEALIGAPAFFIPRIRVPTGRAGKNMASEHSGQGGRNRLLALTPSDHSLLAPLERSGLQIGTVLQEAVLLATGGGCQAPQPVRGLGVDGCLPARKNWAIECR